jgi:hypothetical protein
MNQKSTIPNLTKGLPLLFIAILLSVLAVGISPMQTVYAVTSPPALGQSVVLPEVTPYSDLAISLVSIPKHAKACSTFNAVYTITNDGPDEASGVYVQIYIPDPFEVINMEDVPDELAAGESATVTVTIKVVAFVPGESRSAWVRAGVFSDVYPDISVDPNPDNDSVFTPVRLISKPVLSCP